MDSPTTTPSSSPSDYSFGQHFSNMTQNTSYSPESHDAEENACSLDVDQLAVLKPPHRLFSTPKDGRVLYTINSKEWCYELSNSADLYKSHLSVNAKKLDYQWENVYGATGVVYGIAKILIAMCRNFRIDVSLLFSVCVFRKFQANFLVASLSNRQHIGVRRKGGTRA